MESDQVPFEGVPENVRSIIEHIGLLDELSSEDTEAMYAPLREGRCMVCHTELGDKTLLFITKHGIVAGYCGGPCAQDMAVIGWLEEQHEDIRDGINFRGGRGDQPEA